MHFGVSGHDFVLLTPGQEHRGGKKIIQTLPNTKNTAAMLEHG